MLILNMLTVVVGDKAAMAEKSMVNSEKREGKDKTT
jgi:hypothetical protein